MLKLTRRTEYGLMAMAFMGSRQGEFCSVREIVASLGLPSRLLAEVLKTLARSEFVEAIRGPGGGYRLTRETGRITLAEVVRILEGPMQVTDCQNGGPCELGSSCIIRRGLGRVAGRIENVLEDFTIEDLILAHKGAPAVPCPEPSPSRV